MRRAIVLLSILAAVAHAPSAAAERQPAGPARVEREWNVREWEVPAAEYVRDPAIDADGNVVFAITRGDRIGLFDTKDLHFHEWKLPAGSRPHGTAIGRDGKVFYGGYGNGALGELDRATGAVREHRASSPASKPYAVAIDAKGDVWVTLRGIDRLGRLDRASSRLFEYPMVGQPYSLAVDGRGMVWVSCMGADRLGVFDIASGVTTYLDTGVGSKPRGLALRPDGSLWVTLYGTGKLLRVDTKTRRIAKEYSLPGGDNAGPYSVSVDPSGLVWVTEFQTDTIAVFDPATERFRGIRLPLRDSAVRNATLDGRGRLWYLSSKHGRLGLIE